MISNVNLNALQMLENTKSFPLYPFNIKIFLIQMFEHEEQFKQQYCNSRVRGKFTNDKARRGNDMKIVSL